MRPQRVSSQNKTFATIWRRADVEVGWCGRTDGETDTSRRQPTTLTSISVLLLTKIAWSAGAFCLATRPVWLLFLLLPPSLLLSPGPSLSTVRFSSIYVPLTLCTHFPFHRLRIPMAPLREVCENAQCRSPGVPTPGAECEKRTLHLMPDWPNLLPDSRAFLFPAAQRKQGQKWCGRRGEGTVIVSRSLEIPYQPTNPSPPKPPLS